MYIKSVILQLSMVAIALSILEYVEHLQEKKELIERLLDEGGGYLHVDVIRPDMIPEQFSFTDEQIASLKSLKNLSHYNLHLMTADPDHFFVSPPLENATVTFHWEVTGERKLKELFDRWKATGWRCGVALQPRTLLEQLPQWIKEESDHLLLMSVEAGKGGQQFISVILEKITTARMQFPKSRILVDGGVKVSLLSQLETAGAETLVVGSAITNDPFPSEALARFLKPKNG